MGHIVPRATALRQSAEKAKLTAPLSTALLTVTEACALLRISKWTLYRLIQSNELKTVKIGSRRLIQALEIQSFIERHQAGTGA